MKCVLVATSVVSVLSAGVYRESVGVLDIDGEGNPIMLPPSMMRREREAEAAALTQKGEKNGGSWFWADSASTASSEGTDASKTDVAASSSASSDSLGSTTASPVEHAHSQVEAPSSAQSAEAASVASSVSSVANSKETSSVAVRGIMQAAGSQTAPQEVAFFQALSSQIKQAWFLHGESLIIVVGTRPYWVSPSKDTPVKQPNAVFEALGHGILSDPAAIAQVASEKSLVDMVLWVPDVQSLQSLSRNFKPNVVSSLQKEAKLRAFYKGQERTKETILKMDKAEVLKLGWSTLWFRGGMGREGVLKLAAQALPSEVGAALLEGATAGNSAVEVGSDSSLSVHGRADREWFRSMVRATPSDGVQLEMAQQTQDLLMALAADA